MPVSLEKSIIVALFIVGCCSTTLLTIDQVMAQGSEIHRKNGDVEKDKLVVLSKINIANISKTGMIKVVGAINGEEFVKDIPLSDIGERSRKTLKVNFVMNKENQFVIVLAHQMNFLFVHMNINIKSLMIIKKIAEY